MQIHAKPQTFQYIPCHSHQAGTEKSYSTAQRSPTVASLAKFLLPDWKVTSRQQMSKREGAANALENASLSVFILGVRLALSPKQLA